MQCLDIFKKQKFCQETFIQTETTNPIEKLLYYQGPGRTPPTPGSIKSTSTTNAGALKPSSKAVATGEVKVNVPGWVLRTGGDLTKKTLSRAAQTLP
jgi:hypothetical protein